MEYNDLYNEFKNGNIAQEFDPRKIEEQNKAYYKKLEKDFESLKKKLKYGNKQKIAFRQGYNKAIKDLKQGNITIDSIVPKKLMEKILKKIKEMKKRSYNILNSYSEEAEEIIDSLNDDYEELIEMVEEYEEEIIATNQLEYELEQGDDI